MNFTKKLAATSVIAAGGAITAALAFSATAAADPAAPPPGPAIPGLPLLNELALAPINAPQLLQNVTSALAGAPAVPPAPASPAVPPAATASINVPQPATALPAAVTSPQNLLPNAQVYVPSAPDLPGNLPQQMTLPNALTTLLPSGLPLPGLGGPPAPAPAPAPAAPPAGPPAPGATGPGAPILGGLMSPITALP